MTDAKNDVQSKSQSQAQREQDGKKAMAEYQAEQAATLAKTERLRALRLARDAAMGPKVAKPVAGKKAASKKKAEPAKPLSEWLKSQRDEGRRS